MDRKMLLLPCILYFHYMVYNYMHRCVSYQRVKYQKDRKENQVHAVSSLYGLMTMEVEGEPMVVFFLLFVAGTQRKMNR